MKKICFSIKDLLKPNESLTDEIYLLIGYQFTSYGSYLNYMRDSLQKANPAEYMPQILETTVKPALMTLKRAQNDELIYIDL
ncbi:MAG: hypothetical protein LBL90_04185 [Prevotellaceae bacterium]|jgi:hypothetical protein|nr:hypothetical protein [Prevotellaceae bacterium]